MRGLNQFTVFDFERFNVGKMYVSISQRKWIDDDTGKVIGTKVDSLIWKDGTVYKDDKNGDKITNKYEKVTFKVRKQISVPPNVEIRPVNPIASIYGDYRNQLSVTCDDIEIVQKEANK